MSLDLPRTEYMALSKDFFDFFKCTAGCLWEHEEDVDESRKIES
jgi:hypothetical protein